LKKPKTKKKAPPLLGAGEADLDPYAAHLDRGWELLRKGDYAAAEKSAEEVLELCPEAPEGWVLMGEVQNGLGAPETAIEQFEKAMELDPDFIDPVLHAAETYLGALGDPERAIELCAQAIDLAPDETARADALLIRADAELADDDAAAATATLRELSSAEFEDVSLHLRAGHLLLELQDVAAAERHLRALVSAQPEQADGWHALGLCAEQRGDTREMSTCFRKVRALDLRAPRPAWAIAEEEFEKVVENALVELPERIRTLLANVPVLAADLPAPEIVAEGYDPRMLGFFSGVPYPEKQTIGQTPHLDCIFLYQRNIERVARDQHEMVDEIRKTVLHETGHFFGLSEDDLDEIGLG
jgi:predicted Zn-dependent protease with MMP-like domain/Tfp pilus assembly protein PilF